MSSRRERDTGGTADDCVNRSKHMIRNLKVVIHRYEPVATPKCLLTSRVPLATTGDEGSRAPTSDSVSEIIEAREGAEHRDRKRLLV
jgi:hypothetical protein